MATTRKVPADVGSEELKQVRKQLNRLTQFCEELQTQIADNANYSDFQTDMASITEDDDFELIETDRDRPNRPAYTK